MKPILFNTQMVQAIQADRKTVTRRKPFQMPSDYNELKGLYRDDKNRLCALFQCSKDLTAQAVYAPSQPGDILWVRETWWKNYGHKYGTYFYRADGEEIDIPLITGGTRKHGKADGLKWRPSIHMPKEAARLFLRVTGVRMERLQDITPEDVECEGIDWIGIDWIKNTLLRYDPSTIHSESKRRFAQLWNSTIKPTDLIVRGWDANPWVWVIAFERIDKATAQREEACHA